jgi:hypothetical protein
VVLENEWAAHHVENGSEDRGINCGAPPPKPSARRAAEVNVHGQEASLLELT